MTKMKKSRFSKKKLLDLIDKREALDEEITYLDEEITYYSKDASDEELSKIKYRRRR
jgi:hypothetical protein